MKQNFSFTYKLLLMAGDTLALIASFSLAFIFRVSLDPRPISQPVPALTYITLIATLLPIWLAMFYMLGLYSKRIYSHRPKETGRLIIGALAGVVLLVSFDFFSNEVIFPAKLIPVYATLICFVILWVNRTIMRGLRFFVHTHHIGITKVLLVGDNSSTYYLAKYLYDNPESGYEVVGIVANKRNVYEKMLDKQFKSIVRAIEMSSPHSIIQTDSNDLTNVYNASVEHHLDYRFIPSHEALFTAKHSIDLLGAFPLIHVYTTPLMGGGRIIKRLLDITLSAIGLLVSLPFWIVIGLAIKLDDPKSKVIYSQPRLSRFKQTIHIYKFRTHSRKYNGLTPEEAFAKMGKPELSKEYRKNGDFLKNDPRITKLGLVLRKLSLDELPQLINILKGDISLVGPRALIAQELANYEYKSLILSVKSGLTGLAQISGRRDISFEERRKLDIYYVQNWSIWLDIQIIIRTVFMIITGKGAK